MLSNSELSRRHFLTRAGAFSLGFSGLSTLMARPALGRLLQQPAGDGLALGFGELVRDPAGIFDLPAGFRYRVLARAGDEMDDGLLFAGKPDGMAAFPGENGRTVIVCNHEIELAHGRIGAFGPSFERLGKVPADAFYDRGGGKTPCQGGTSTIIYDTRSGKVERRFLSLAGTCRNCAGGPTPWGSWLTCEESVYPTFAFDRDGMFDKPHGYVFEVPAAAAGVIRNPQPLKAMGRFNHEAVAVDPDSGVVYLTEDRDDGLLYRFIPKTRGRLADGGRLQAMVVKGKPVTAPSRGGGPGGVCTRNWGTGPEFSTSDPVEVAWIDLDNVDTPDDNLRERGFAAGAARFARGEGMWQGLGAVFFACTTGGKKQIGQIWKYVPGEREGDRDEAGGRLSLMFEAHDSNLVVNADNLTVSPWGDLIVCEDSGNKVKCLFGVTPDGQAYRIGRNALNESELAGACFSPDGSTLFVNIQNPGTTLAITGDWRSAGR